MKGTDWTTFSYSPHIPVPTDVLYFDEFSQIFESNSPKCSIRNLYREQILLAVYCLYMPMFSYSPFTTVPFDIQYFDNLDHSFNPKPLQFNIRDLYWEQIPLAENFL